MTTKPHSASPQIIPETLTAREIAFAIGSSYETVLRLIKRGKIKCLPMRHKRVPRAEFERFLKEGLK